MGRIEVAKVLDPAMLRFETLPVQASKIGPTFLASTYRGSMVPLVTADDDGPVFTETEKPTVAKVKAGDAFTVRLEAAHGTGYNWTVSTADDDRCITQQGEATVENLDPSKPGGKQIIAYHFKASKTGQARIIFRYARPWENDKAPAKTFELSLTVDAK